MCTPVFITHNSQDPGTTQMSISGSVGKGNAVCTDRRAPSGREEEGNSGLWDHTALRELSQTEKDKHRMSSLVRGI